MQKGLFILSFILLLFFRSSAQKINLIGTLINSKDSKPIGYVSTKLLKSNIYFDTDEKGFFSISGNIDDTIYFSCI